jgi:precorrin-8X/cobalt-precorrin-8 methylmutase
MDDRDAAVVLLGHGSRLESANRALEEVAQRVAALLGVARVETAFLQLARPGLEEAVERCVRAGARRVAVVPFFLFPGVHVLDDIPHAVAALTARHPGVEMTVTPALGGHPKLAEAAADRVREVLI